MAEFEPYLAERIEKARARARQIIDGQYDDEESLCLALRWFICQNRNRLFFDSYFDDRTLDDLVFEVEMMKLAKQSSTDRGSETLKDAPKEESEALFDDWVEADTNEAEKKFEEDAKKFMQTGEFKP